MTDIVDAMINVNSHSLLHHPVGARLRLEASRPYAVPCCMVIGWKKSSPGTSTSAAGTKLAGSCGCAEPHFVRHSGQRADDERRASRTRNYISTYNYPSLLASHTCSSVLLQILRLPFRELLYPLCELKHQSTGT